MTATGLLGRQLEHSVQNDPVKRKAVRVKGVVVLLFDGLVAQIDAHGDPKIVRVSPPLATEDRSEL